MMILLIDNFDSFTYNIYQYLKDLKQDVVVKRNNEITIKEIKDLDPSHIIISPGPGNPDSAGISVDVIKKFSGKVPILGVCLGHQCIAKAYGGNVVKAGQVMHGKSSKITHVGDAVLTGIPSPFEVIRYHSLVIEKKSCPEDLIVTAESEDGEIQAVMHKELAVYGVQFHPESIGSSYGHQLFENFLKIKNGEPYILKAIKKVMQGEHLSVSESQKVMENISEGKATSSQIASVLTAMRLNDESADEITGFAKVMRARVTHIKKPDGKYVVDTCGTGGDVSGTFNISTAAAFVTAGAGVCVAKHGNRSMTSQCGSADVLEALGVNLTNDVLVMERALEQIGICFMFAPLLHASMRYAVPVRKELGVRTVFNLLGPLANPAGADSQVMGVFDANLTEKIAQVMVNLGMKRGMVVHGNDGLDEITSTTTTKISEIKDGWVQTYQFDPAKYGFKFSSAEDLIGGNVLKNASILKGVLEGQKGSARDIVIINAAASIYIGKGAESFEEGIALAIESIDSGKANLILNELVRITNE